MRELDEAMRANLILGQQKSRTPKQLVKDWPTLKIDAKRGVIRAYVERVTVGKADPKRRRWQPIDERVDVRWVGQPGQPASRARPAPPDTDQGLSRTRSVSRLR